MCCNRADFLRESSSDNSSDEEQKHDTSSDDDQVLIPASKYIPYLSTTSTYIPLLSPATQWQMANLGVYDWIEDPAEQVFDDNMLNVNTFLQRIAKFEMATNSQITDLWRIKDMAF